MDEMVLGVTATMLVGCVLYHVLRTRVMLPSLALMILILGAIIYERIGKEMQSIRDREYHDLDQALQRLLQVVPDLDAMHTGPEFISFYDSIYNYAQYNNALFAEMLTYTNEILAIRRYCEHVYDRNHLRVLDTHIPSLPDPFSEPRDTEYFDPFFGQVGPDLEKARRYKKRALQAMYGLRINVPPVILPEVERSFGRLAAMLDTHLGVIDAFYRAQIAHTGINSSTRVVFWQGPDGLRSSV